MITATDGASDDPVFCILTFMSLHCKIFMIYGGGIMYSIAIVDDEAVHIKNLSDYIERFFKENGGAEYRISVFNDGDELLKDYHAAYDIVFLDIEMERVNGMKAARIIRKTDEDTAIIFVTHMARFAIKGYEVNALDFIVKPVDYFSFALKMKKAIKYVDNNLDNSIEIRISDAVYSIKERDIYYVESIEHNVIFHTAIGEFKLYGTLKAFAERLSKSTFVMCNRCYIVNMRHVDSVVGKIAVVHGCQLVISRYKKNEFMQALVTYWGKKS